MINKNVHVHITQEHKAQEQKEEEMHYIGIDLGTSAVKLLLMQGDGRILKIVSREYPISFPKPGWSEQNPEDWYRETMAGL